MLFEAVRFCPYCGSLQQSTTPTVTSISSSSTEIAEVSMAPAIGPWGAASQQVGDVATSTSTQHQSNAAPSTPPRTATDSSIPDEIAPPQSSKRKARPWLILGLVVVVAAVYLNARDYRVPNHDKHKDDYVNPVDMADEGGEGRCK
jgi:hypothetical protein